MAGFKGGFGGGFGGVNQMQNLMRQAQKLQEEMKKAQAELDEVSIEGVGGNGLVKVNMTAKKEVTGITIDPNAVDTEDLTMLEDLIIVALNDGYKKADEICNQKMGAFGNLGL